MLRGALLAGFLLLDATARAANFQPLKIDTSGVWLQSISAQGSSAQGGEGNASISAPAGQQPVRLEGELASAYFSLYTDAQISAAEDSIAIDLSGSASSYQSISVNVNAGSVDLSIPLPESSQSVVQIFADWSLATAPGWRTSGYFSCAQEFSAPESLEIVGLGNVSEVSKLLAVRLDPLLSTSPTQVGVATLPSGETVRARCSLRLGLTATGQLTGPFYVTGTLRFRIAQPLPLGDSNADGVADLVDVVVLRRQLVGAPVNLP